MSLFFNAIEDEYSSYSKICSHEIKQTRRVYKTSDTKTIIHLSRISFLRREEFLLPYPNRLLDFLEIDNCSHHV